MHLVTNSLRMSVATLLCVAMTIAGAGFANGATVEIVGVGDILLDRGVRKQINKYGTGFPFEKIHAILTGADLSIGNLENPLTDQCEKSAKKYSFRADAAYSEILSDAGFDVFSLANNHTLDCGEIGLAGTRDALEAENIRYAGLTGGTPESVPPLIIEIKGVKIGFASFTAISPVGPGEPFSGISKAEPEHIERSITGLKERADVVIASFHWGTEYALSVNEEQIKLARLAVDSGADVVLGHHPHVLQRIEAVDRGPCKTKALIAFSLGNFVFDSPVRLNRHVGDSILIRIAADSRGLKSAEVIPVEIQKYRPVVAVGNIRERIEERIMRISGKFGTKILDNKIDLSTGKSGKDCGGN